MRNFAVNQRLGAVCVLAGTVLFSPGAAANEAPTAPGNFTAIAVSSTEIRLSWDPSVDDKRVRFYELVRDEAVISRTGKLTYTDNNLSAGVTYLYTVVASDGQLVSPVASYSISTPLADPDETDNSPGKSGKNGKGGKNDPAPEEPPTEDPPAEEPPVEEPPAEEPPTEDPPVEEPPAEEPPTEEPPAGGAPQGWQVTFNDDFSGSGDLDISSAGRNWRFETMSDGLHRAGNTGINADGQLVESWNSVRGKRWSAWYDDFNTANAYRENGALIMGGHHSGITDPTRPVDYVDDGVPTQYGDSKLYTAWIDTFARKWVGPGGLHVMDPDSPGKIFKYGYIETRIDFSGMMTPGFRLSMWLMPASNDPEGQDLVVHTAYDADGNNGVEIDLFEYEWVSAELENRIQLAVLGGAAGSSHTTFDTESVGINLHEGYHTIGFLWTADRMVWTIDGHVAKEVLDTELIPDVYSYLVISREMNSGVKRPDIDYVAAGDMLEEWPYIPRDPGLYAKNIWEYRNRINADRANVDYIRVWQP